VRIKAFIAFIDGLVDKEIIQLNLLKPLMIEMHSQTPTMSLTKQML